jgi:hypothetical protein
MSVFRVVRRGLRSLPRPSSARLDAWLRAFSYADFGYVVVPASPGPVTLTDEQLAEGWRTTSRILRRSTSTARKVVAVEEREWYLEEFARRNPRGFEAWLASGSRAPDDLMPYLGEHRLEPAAIDWDELTGGRG